MIRREPTVITLGDADVQDVKAIIARQKEAGDTLNRLAREQAARPFVAAEDAKRKREEMSTEDRLGMR